MGKSGRRMKERSRVIDGVVYRLCSTCKEEKVLEQFSKSSSRGHGPDGFRYSCKLCEIESRKKGYTKGPISEEKKEYLKEYYRKNKERIKKDANEYYENNKGKILERLKDVRNDPTYKENYKEYARDWRNRPEVKEKIKNKYDNDINYKMTRVLRGRVSDALKCGGSKKSQKTTELLGCSIMEAIQHIENQFKEGMRWDNHGFGDDKWHIDHIIPCSSFDLSKEEERKKCFHYTNLQPLWQKENLSKGDKIL